MGDEHVLCLWDLVFCLRVSFVTVCPLPHHSASLTLWHLLAKAVLTGDIYIAVAVCPLLQHYFVNHTGRAFLLFLRSRGAPHLHNNTTVLDLSSVHQSGLSCCCCSAVTPLVCGALFLACVFRKAESRSQQEWVCTPTSKWAGQTSCLVLTDNPSACNGHLSSYVPPFTWPRRTTGEDNRGEREGGEGG